MIGIYKISNNINHHFYIGQSRDIHTRWKNEKCASNNPNEESYNYPLSRAFRKYGIQNFTFEIIEECKVEELNEKEHYWISKLKPNYNQTSGGDYQTHGKLSYQQVEEIQRILLEDTEGEISHKELAIQYSVSPDTIQAINAGRSWSNSKLTYPLHLSKYDKRREKQNNFCIDCGKKIYKDSSRCLECENIRRKQNKNSSIFSKISRDELKSKIRNQTFTSIGQEYGVTDNAIKKWCDFYNLPRTKKEIKSYSDEQWFKI